MKEKMGMIISIVLCLCVTSCRNRTDYPYYDMKTVSQGQALYAFMPQTLSDLQNHCSDIVQGKVESGGETIDLSEGGSLPINSTMSSMKITKVIKGNLNEGDTIQLCEGYYIKEDENGETMLCLWKNYMPSNPDIEYIYFLGKIGDGSKFAGAYGTLIHEMGRYPVINTNARTALDVKTMPVEDLYIHTNDQIYRDIYQEVIDEYMK